MILAAAWRAEGGNLELCSIEAERTKFTLGLILSPSSETSKSKMTSQTQVLF